MNILISLTLGLLIIGYIVLFIIRTFVPTFMMPMKYCTTCGHEGRIRKFTKGSFLVELFLYLFFIIPGLIYSIWRSSDNKHVCNECGSINLIPINSKIALEKKRA